LERFQTAQFASLKKTPDGKTILVPQPSDDPNDPLNVSAFPLSVSPPPPVVFDLLIAVELG
jgi:hypothetical protein